MKAKKSWIVLLIFVLLGMVSMSSCRSSYGCPAKNKYEKNKDKPPSNKKGKSKLFKLP